METAKPGQTVVLTVPDIPSGSTVGVQVMKAVSGTVAIGRTLNGVTERPAGTGNFVITFPAPVESDLYMVIVDWNGGVLEQETSKVIDLKVAMETVSSGDVELSAVGNQIKLYLGGETWQWLYESERFGAGFIALAIDTVKARVSKTPITTSDEEGLPRLVVDYLGLLSALELINAARDYWGSQLIAQTVGEDSTEMVTYPNRVRMIDTLRENLQAKVAHAQALALPLLDQPVLMAAGEGPLIDEDDDMVRATADPRCFPPAEDFPYAYGGDFTSRGVLL